MEWPPFHAGNRDSIPLGTPLLPVLGADKPLLFLIIFATDCRLWERCEPINESLNGSLFYFGICVFNLFREIVNDLFDERIRYLIGSQGYFGGLQLR